MERRKPPTPLSKFSPLPADFLKLVREVFMTNFDAGLKAFSAHHAKPYFDVQGRIYTDEIILAISLMAEGQISATTAYASVDYDPKANLPSTQDLLGECVDAVASLFATLLTPDDPKRLEQLADESLGALEDIPFDWTPVKVEKRTIHIKLDKSNPKIEELADEWLLKNDPKLKEREEEERKAAEALFVTGPNKNKGERGSGSGTLH